ncbi:MAG TPA: hypothetical protein VG056_10835 [Pirellulales bacterium]|jgi:hypothetical protein|nr:hypothetical protein [Pirellulales bacterium]
MRPCIGLLALWAFLLGCTKADPPATELPAADGARAGSVNATVTNSDSTTRSAKTPQTESVVEARGEPEDVLRRFLMASLSHDETGIRATTLPNPEVSLLWQGPRVSSSETSEAIKSVAFRRLKVGDEVKISGGKKLLLDETYVNENRQQITGPDFPFPFILVKESDGWKVDAFPIIAARKAAAAEMRKNADTSSTPTWSPDSTLLEKLSQEMTLTGWRLRPPAEYKFVEQNAPPVKVFIWAGPVQKDETFATMTMLLLPAGPVEKNSELGSLLTESLKEIEKRRDTWTTSPPESGRIGDLDFIRARWSGVCTVGKKQLIGKKMHGVVYLAKDSDAIVEIMLEDVEPNHEKSLPICEAAVWTLRRTEP